MDDDIQKPKKKEELGNPPKKNPQTPPPPKNIKMPFYKRGGALCTWAPSPCLRVANEKDCTTVASPCSWLTYLKGGRRKKERRERLAHTYNIIGSG